MNFIKKIALLVLFWALGYCSVNAQQTPTFGHYNYNPFILNAAYAGLTPDTELAFSNSGYYNQFEGSPRSFSLSGHGAIHHKKSGVGAGILRDQIGVTSSTNFFAAYSYNIFFDFKSNRPYWQPYDAGVLAFALTAGVLQYQDNLTELGIPNDPNFSQNINASIPTIGFGFMFNHASFFLGVSTPNILGDALASQDNLNLSTPYYAYIGYRFFNNRFKDLMIKPSLLLKYENGAAFQTDINVTVSVKNTFETGIGYRTNQSINLLAGVYLFNNARIIYSYNIGPNNSPLGNTHGFTINYRFNEGYKTR